MYIFYLDESGEREYESGSQYFVLCAFGVPVQLWQDLDARVSALKSECFGCAEVEIKSSWLRRARERQKHYLQRFRISEESLRRFTEKLYQAILLHDVVLLACVIDKYALQQASPTPESPVVRAYLTLLEQIETFLNSQQTYGVIVFDKINESQYKKYGYEQELAKQHHHWRQQAVQKRSTVRVVEGLLFMPSHEHNFIQLADLCAYNIYRQFVDYGHEWDEGFRNKYPYFELIEGKFSRDATDGYRGCGLVKYPEDLMTGSVYSPTGP